MSTLLSTATLAAALTSAQPLPAAEPVSLEEFVRLQRPMPSAQLAYGPAQVQGIDVFVPQGKGPFPVAILIHGGCWRNLPGAGREQLRHIGKALADRGIATWSIGYRRADETGGGYPGTFLDVAAGIDRLRAEAPRYGFDLKRTVAVGHSAGGHLALWAAARDSLPQGSALFASQPFIPRATISLAGVGDLRDFGRFVPVLCGPGVFESLVPADGGEGLYAQISPAQMPPPSSPVLMVSGTLDRLVPPYVAHDYAVAMARGNGPSPARVDIADAGHFDLVTPGTPAWEQVLHAIENALVEQR